MAKKAAPSSKAPPVPAPLPAKAAARGKPSPAAKPAVATKAAETSAAKAPAAVRAKPTPATTVTLKHLSATLAEKHDLPKKQADILLADVFGLVVEHLKAGERVRIGGLGIIEVKDRPARMARNPATGQAIQVAASRKIAFRAAKELKAAV